MRPTRRTLLAVGALAVAVTAASATTSAARNVSWSASPGKPVIGAPSAVPAKAQAGKPFTVSFRVTSSTTRKPLTTGLMAGATTVGGKAIAHRQSFRGGIARVSLVVPAVAGGKVLRVTVTIRSGGQSATRTALYPVAALPKPAISIADASVTEGSAGTTSLSFPVTLSATSAQVVTVAYATSDGSATAPADYAAASGTLTFAPGETAKAVTVNVVADTAIETDETLTVTLSNPVNATIAQSSATGTVKNDDTQVPVTTGSWKGSTPTGDYMYFEVNADRTMSYFRLNDIRENCNPGGYFEGTLAFRPDIKWPIAADGTSGSAATWTGTDVEGDITFTYEAYKVVAHFNGSSATGTFRLQDNFTYQGTSFTCDTGDVAWTAAKI
jgi:hypothetical protein